MTESPEDLIYSVCPLFADENQLNVVLQRLIPKWSTLLKIDERREEVDSIDMEVDLKVEQAKLLLERIMCGN